MKKYLKRMSMRTFILIFALLFINTQRSTAQPKERAESFYKDATLRFIVPYSPGGSSDIWARTLVPYLKKYTGANLIVENMPGGSGLVSGGYLYSRAKPDGLTVAILPMPGMILANLLELDEAKYEVERFSYVGRVESAWRGFLASKASGFKSIADMQKSNKVIRFGSVDPTSQTSVDAALIAEAFNLKVKIIPGYKGSKEFMLALLAGRELDIETATIPAYEEKIKNGELTLIAMMGKKRHPDFPKVPYLLETKGLKPEGRSYLELLYGLEEGGRMITAPPGIPEDRRIFLENALSKSLREKDLVSWAKKEGYNITPLPGQECKKVVAKLLKIVPKSERPKLKEIITKKYF